ncbi:putative type III restriction endonuclease subunit R [Thermus phage phiLo]|nr:putative type III restriction endonuclease subunit R [Thermus phage phiLo]
MARATAKRENKPLPAKANSIPLLQERLLLNRYLCNQLGFEHFRQMRDALKDIKEGWDAGGHSHFYWRLVGQQGLKVPPDKLATYDLRIKDYVDQLNSTGERHVQLKYFQYLAALFTEIYLDDLFSDRERLLRKLNEFVEEENRKLPKGIPSYELFTEADLDKLAFWMATGSGKTLVMHINLWQYEYYSQGKRGYNNVLLITPNEGLSQQHLDELDKSGIPAIHHKNAGSLSQGNGLVRVIEITKLTKTKRGEGQSVDVDAFGPNNLLLVDEGHRGASGEVWRELRQRLAEQGFTFEYSATFGQIVNGASKDKRPALLEEYSKAILFDYSYPHFHEDGYGKDYWILNLKDETDTLNDWLLLGNLLSFYEQLLLYEEHRESFRPYNLEKPLWVFVGNTVIGRKAKGDEREPSDVEEIVLFFDSFLRKPKHWIDRIGKVLAGQTGLKKRSEGEGEKDIFADLFPYLKERYRSEEGHLSPEAIYEDVVRRVFGAQVGERLRAVELKTATGEIGLRAGADRPYFGVINVGDVSGLMKLLRPKGIACEEENITGSLFSRINEPDSRVNVLIGSRKFMEGWDSFRVSSMGLMNIGKGEGAQIIQLFGRGVRLWGKGLSLKRSSALGDSSAPPHIRLLETLNVFGVRANYMAQFREYLKQEGIEAEFEEIPLPVVVQKEFLKSGLQVLRLPEEERFEDKKGVVLEVDGKVKVTLDLRPRFELAESRKKKEEAEKVGGEDRAEALRQSAHLFDWRRIYFELLAFKRLRGFHNLSFGEADLRKVIERGKYEVFCPNGGLPPSGYREIRRAEDIAIAVLQKYVATFYDRKRRAWEREHIKTQVATYPHPTSFTPSSSRQSLNRVEKRTS